MKSEWKDIASAPTDGRLLLLVGQRPPLKGRERVIGCYDGEDWCDYFDCRFIPTHWMELPLPPEIVSSKP